MVDYTSEAGIPAMSNDRPTSESEQRYPKLSPEERKIVTREVIRHQEAEAAYKRALKQKSYRA